MIKGYGERSVDEHGAWLDGWDDHTKGRECRYDSLVGAGGPHADYYLAGWKAVGEFADEMERKCA